MISAFRFAFVSHRAALVLVRWALSLVPISLQHYRYSEQRWNGEDGDHNWAT